VTSIVAGIVALLALAGGLFGILKLKKRMSVAR